MGKRLILREVRKAYEIPSCYLRDHAGFEIMDLLDQDEKPIQSKGAWLRQGMKSWGRMLRCLGRIRRGKQVVLIGNYMSLFAVLLNKLHLIHPDRLYWWGFQIRGARMQQLLRYAFRVLYSENLRFILFSGYEKSLYAERLGLKEEAFLSLPYGDWAHLAEDSSEEDSSDGAYYFSGGYSNRDYAGLISAWEGIDRELVIIGSENNRDLLSYTRQSGRPNVKVLLDTTSDVFDRYLAGAKACILPFKSDSGAAGQTVALRCMKRGKLIVSSRISAMVEYTDNGRTGFLLRDFSAELPKTIDQIETEPEKCENMLKEQKKLFEERFSYDVVTKRLLELFET